VSSRHGFLQVNDFGSRAAINPVFSLILSFLHGLSGAAEAALLLLLGFWSFSAFQETNILEHWTDFCATRSPRACAVAS
jgi:hypothetical protein